MYKIYSDGVCIYDDTNPLEKYKLLSPSLILEKGKAGSLDFTMPPANIGYDTVKKYLSDITLEKNGQEIWEGRVIDEDKDFWNCRKLKCEGSLAFFNDTVQPQWESESTTVLEFFTRLITIHNSRLPAGDYRRFAVGRITVTTPNVTIRRFTDYETTYDCLTKKLVDELGGHLHVRKENGIRYLDYLKEEFFDSNTQTIEFGKNLLDFTRNWSLTELCTVLIPLGKTKDESQYNLINEYVDIKSVNDGSLYLEASPESIALYGRVEKVVKWEDIENPTELKAQGELYLRNTQFKDMTIEMSAVDLSIMGVAADDFSLGDYVHVISKPHGLDKWFPIDKLEIPLDAPEDTKFELNGTEKVAMSTAVASSSSAIQTIEKQPIPSAILDKAKQEAASLITSATTGYITTLRNQNGVPYALIISTGPDYSSCNSYWMWSNGGLAHIIKDPISGELTTNNAMTSDGKIVADMITAGILTLTGSMKIQSADGTSFGVDANGDTVINGNLTLGPDSIITWDRRNSSDSPSKKEISESSRMYAVSSTEQAPSKSSYTAEIPEMSSYNKYLWSYIVIEYVDGTTEDKTPEIIAVYDDSGSMISGVTEMYATSPSPIATPDLADYSTTIPTLSFWDTYLWNYTIISYIDGPDKKTVPKIIGCSSKDGRGIESITPYYALSNSGTTAPTDPSSWGTTPLTPTTANRYLWSYSVTTYTDGNNTTTEPAVIGVHGEDGSDASVTFANIKAALQQAESTETSFITADAVGAPNIYGGKIYGTEIYAGNGSSTTGYAKMATDGLEVKNSSGQLKVKLDLGASGNVDTPYLQLGIGTDSNYTNAGLVQKFTHGLWVGNYQANSSATDYPRAASGVIGIFIDFTTQTLWWYDGTASRTAIGDNYLRFTD